jgi:hypothetical protein
LVDLRLGVEVRDAVLAVRLVPPVLRLGAAVLRFDEAVLRLVERLKEVLLRFANLGLQPVLRTFRACAASSRTDPE